jgi:hypothetical protein
MFGDVFTLFIGSIPIKKNAVQSSFLLTDALGFPFEIYVLGNTVVPDLLLMS